MYLRFSRALEASGTDTNILSLSFKLACATHEQRLNEMDNALIFQEDKIHHNFAPISMRFDVMREGNFFWQSDEKEKKNPD